MEGVITVIIRQTPQLLLITDQSGTCVLCLHPHLSHRTSVHCMESEKWGCERDADTLCGRVARSSLSRWGGGRERENSGSRLKMKWIEQSTNTVISCLPSIICLCPMAATTSSALHTLWVCTCACKCRFTNMCESVHLNKNVDIYH